MIAVAFALAAALVQTTPAQNGGVGGGQGGVTPSSTAQAATAPAGPAPASTPAAERPRLICTNEQVTGSRFPIRRCRTARQTTVEREESQDMLNRMNGSRNDPQF